MVDKHNIANDKDLCEVFYRVGKTIAEYFIDNDPGNGNGISLGSFNSFTEEISYDLNSDML